MNASDYTRVINTHPNKVEVLYMGTSTIGIYNEEPIEVFQEGIKRLLNKTLTVVTESFPTINKKINPNILIDNVSYAIQDHYSENKFLTVIVI